MRTIYLDLSILGGAALSATGLWWWWPTAAMVFLGVVISGGAVMMRLGATTERKQ